MKLLVNQNLVLLAFFCITVKARSPFCCLRFKDIVNSSQSNALQCLSDFLLPLDDRDTEDELDIDTDEGTSSEIAERVRVLSLFSLQYV